MNDLHDLLDQVQDQASFLNFVHALMLERAKEDEHLDKIDGAGRGIYGWENHSITDFLHAALSWADAMPESERFPAEPSWQTFAAFLYMGKIYE